MKFGFIGNMNNNHFSTVRFLRDRGVDAELLLTNDEQSHFHPSCDTIDTDYMKYTRRLAWGSWKSFLKTDSYQIKNDLKGFDVLVGCGLAPAYCSKAGIFLDIFTPYGSDLYWETRIRYASPKHFLNVLMATIYQRKGIRESKVFHMAPSSDYFESMYQKYASNVIRWYEGMPMVYIPPDRPIGELYLNKTQWQDQFMEIRRESDLVVFSHGRHYWGDRADPDSKGVDSLLEGWKLFIDSRPNLNATLIFLEYGRDVDKSRNYIDKLGLSDSVRWLPQMFRKDILYGMSTVDIVVGEFVHSWVARGVIFEGLAMEKPIITCRSEAHSSEKDIFQVYSACTPDAIASSLNEFLDDIPKGRVMGKSGNEWYLNEVVKKSVDNYMKYAQSK